MERNAEFKLLCRLRASSGFGVLGGAVERGLTGGVCLSAGGRLLGIWRFSATGYEFATRADGEAHQRATDCNDAVRQSIIMLASALGFAAPDMRAGVGERPAATPERRPGSALLK